MLVLLIDKALQVRGLLHCDVAVLVGHQDVEADILPVVPLALGQLVLLDVADRLFGAHQLGHLEHLVDVVVALDEGGLPEDLRAKPSTMPAMIMPALQQSTR